MGKRVICISRSVAAGGERVATSVAERLGYRYMDEEIIRLAGEKADVDPRVVADAEQRTSVIARLVDALFARPASETYSLFHHDAPHPKPPTATTAELRALIRGAIRETARRGNVVIVAHAASFAVGSGPDVLRVLVTASPETRAQRLWLDGHFMSEQEAEQTVAESDEERAHYLRSFYDVAHELSTHYDVVVNTDALSTQDAATMILALARA
jgi:cytidylate kinase